jgi:DUF971 family protein
MPLNEKTPWPTEIRLNKDKDELTVAFDGGESFSFPAEMLRVMSPSAEVQGHSPEQRTLVYGKRNVKIMILERVGNYAIKIHFDDLHNTGIFSWSYFHDLGREKDKRWQSYLEELEKADRSR